MTHQHICVTCKTIVAVCDKESCEPDDPHYCSVHVPKEINEEEGHEYEGSRLEMTPPLSRVKK
jgi:hypothetical protein